MCTKFYKHSPKLFLLSIGLLMGLGLFAQPVLAECEDILFREDFKDCAQPTTMTNTATPFWSFDGGWTFDPVSVNSIPPPNDCWARFSDVAGDNVPVMRTPGIDVSAYVDARVSFYYVYQDDNFNPEDKIQFFIQRSSDLAIRYLSNTGTWEPVETHFITNFDGDGYIEVDLPTDFVAGNNDLLLYWRYDDGTDIGAGCAIDDITVTGVKRIQMQAGANSLVDNGCNNADGGTLEIPMLFLEGNGPFTVEVENTVIPAAQVSQSGNTLIVTGIPPGNYTGLSVKSGNSLTCVSSRFGYNYEIFPAIGIKGAIPVDATTCGGLGAIIVSLSPNNDTYEYSLEGSSPTVTGTATSVGGEMEVPAPAGSYSKIYIINDNKCEAFFVDNLDIKEPNPFINTSISVTNPGCGVNDGILSIVHNPQPSGTNYTYLWSTNPPRTTQTVSGLNVGTYSATVTETNTMCDTVYTATVQMGDGVTNINVIRNENAGCDSSGIATITFDASVATTIEWSDGQTTAQATGLEPGINTVTISTSTCEFEASVLMNYGAVITLEEVTADHQDNICSTDMDGQITVEASGMWVPFTYSWSGPDNYTGTSNNGLATGVYSITATDDKTCTKVIDIAINSIPALTATPLIVQPLCNGESTGLISLNLTGGTPPYNYLWDNGATTKDLTNLSAGDYSYTFSDAISCTTTSSITVGEPAVIVAAIASSSNVSCNGAADGSISLTVTGGSGTYTYAWNNTAATGQNPTDLDPNNYSCTITDANGCTATAATTISEPPVLTVVPTTQELLCNGGSDGSITIVLTGGTPNYTYLWDNGATTKDLMNLFAGSYTYTFTDANGCAISDTVELLEPTVVTAAIPSIMDILCFGESTGSLSAEGAGGTGTFTYLWSNTETTAQVTDLLAGSYTVTITDANGCTETAEKTLTQPASALSATYTSINATCLGISNGEATITATGGTAPYTFLWPNGATTSEVIEITVGTFNVTITDANACTSPIEVIVGANTPLGLSNDPVDMLDCFGDMDGMIDITISNGSGAYSFNWSNNATTEDISNLGFGAYFVQVTDANTSCTTSSTFTVVQPDVIETVSDLNQSDCIGTIITLPEDAIGGTGALTYDWSSGTNQVLAGEGGTLSVTDANNCTVDFPFTTSIEPGASFINADQDSLFIDQTTDNFSLNLTQYYYTFGSVTFDWTLTYDLQGTINNETGNVLSLVDLSLPDLANGVMAINRYVLTINPQAQGECNKDELVIIIRIIPTVDYNIEAFIPEIFTPNGDGYNDTWQITEWTTDFENWTYAIFNRNGAEVISNNMSSSWSGQDATGNEYPDGVYWVVIRDESQAVRYKGAITKLSR